MQTVRRDALRLLGMAAGGSVLSGRFGEAIAGPATNYIDHYCYCADMLVSAEADTALKVISTGDGHSLWSSGYNKREIAPGLWRGISIFTEKPSIHLRFKVDPKRYLVDYLTGSSDETLQLGNWARVLPGKTLGYNEATSLVALYQPRRSGTSLEKFLEDRSGHAAEMYRIKGAAEHGKVSQTSELTTGQYAASYSQQVSASVDKLFDFITDGMIYGKYTWGRAPRTKVGDNTFKCKSDFGGADLFVRYDADGERKIVDYYTGHKSDALMLTQSARIFAGPALGYDANASLVVFTRWRGAKQSDIDWDFAMANQVNETNMVKANLENDVRE